MIFRVGANYSVEDEAFGGCGEGLSQASVGLYKVEIDSNSLRNTSLIEELYLLAKEKSSIGLVLLIFCFSVMLPAVDICFCHIALKRDGLSHWVGCGLAGVFHICWAGSAVNFCFLFAQVCVCQVVSRESN